MKPKSQEKNLLQKTSVVFRRLLRFVCWVAAFGIVLCLMLYVLMHVPAVQRHLVSQANTLLQERVSTHAEISGLDLSFPRSLVLKGAYLEDFDGDTLLYSHRLAIALQPSALLRRSIVVQSLSLQGAIVNLYRPADKRLNLMAVLELGNGTIDPVPQDTVPSFNLSISDIDLSAFKMRFLDDQTGMDLRIALNDLDLKLRSSDLHRLAFEVTALSIAGPDVSLQLSEPPGQTGYRQTSDERGVNTDVNVILDGTLDIQDARFQFGNEEDTIAAGSQEILIGRAQFGLLSQFVDAEEVMIKDGFTYYHQKGTSQESPDQSAESSPPTLTGGWTILAHDLLLENSGYDVSVGPTALSSGTVGLLEIQDIVVSDTTIEGSVLAMRTEHSDSLEIHNFNGQLMLQSSLMKIQQMNLQTKYSTVQGDFEWAYPLFNLNRLARDQADLSISLQPSTVALEELEVLMDSVDLPSLSVALKLEAQGSLATLRIDTLLATSSTGQIAAQGTVSNVGSAENLVGDIRTSMQFSNDLITTLLPSTEQLLQLPGPEMSCDLHVQGSLQTADANYELAFSEGTVEGSARWTSDTLTADFQLSRLDIGSLLRQVPIGPVTGTVRLEGTEVLNDRRQLAMDAQVESLSTARGTFEDLQLNGSLVEDGLQARIVSLDPQLQLRAEGQMGMDTTGAFQITMEAERIDLASLGWKDDPYPLSLLLEATGALRPDLNLTLRMEDLTSWLQDDEQRLEEVLSLEAKVSADTSWLRASSTSLSLAFDANFDPTDLQYPERLSWAQYLDPMQQSWAVDSKRFSIHARAKNAAIMGLLIEDLTSLNLDSLMVQYDGPERRLMADVYLPEVVLSQIALDSLSLQIAAQPTQSDLDLWINDIHYDSLLHLPDVHLLNRRERQQMLTSLSLGESAENPLYHLNLISSPLDSSSTASWLVQIEPNSVLLDGNKWQVDPSNEVEIVWEEADVQAKPRHFVLNHDNERIEMSRPVPSTYSIALDGVQLQSLTHLFQLSAGEELPLSGVMTAKATVSTETWSKGSMDLVIDELHLQSEPLGTLRVNATVDETSATKIDSRLSNGMNALHLMGQLPANDDTTSTTLRLGIQLQDISTLGAYLPEGFAETSGSVLGEIVTRIQEDEYTTNGHITLYDVTSHIKDLNNRIMFERETLKIQDDRLRLDDIQILNSRNDTLDINGWFDLKHWREPKFQLTLQANEYLVSDTPPREEQVSGKFIAGFDVAMNVDEMGTQLNLDLTVEDSSTIVYRFAPSDFALTSDEDIVVWGSPSNDDGKSIPATSFQAFDALSNVVVDSKLFIEPDVLLRIDIDPQSGDYLELRGEGEVLLTSELGQKPSFSGIYEIRDGIYKLSYFGLARKDFVIKGGSSVTWAGEFEEASIMIDASHGVRAIPYGLMVSEVPDMSESAQQSLRNTLPFELLLRIRGNLEDPTITFELQLPRDLRLNYPSVSAKLDQLNNAEDPSQLHRQVLGLLTLGGFIPEDIEGSQMAPALASTAVANSVNSILTNELNKVSGQLLKGVDVNVGLSSYADFGNQGAETQTTMNYTISKKVLNDRMSIQATGNMDLTGSNEQPTKLRGDFVLLYDLTRDGRFKLKSYDEAAYDIIHKDIRNSGLSVIFVREFDGLKRRKSGRKE